jgi:hypothetical protein
MAGLGLFDPELCATTLKECGYRLEHINNEKEGRLIDLMDHRDSMMSQTELNQWFIDNSFVEPFHPNVQVIK